MTDSCALLFPRGLRNSLACLLTAAPFLFCGHRAGATPDQLVNITNYFTSGNDAFEIDAYPGVAANIAGWAGAWTFSNGETNLIATVINENPLFDPTNDNYLNVTITNTTSQVAVRRQYTTYGTPAPVQTFSVSYIPHRVEFDIRMDSFTNTVINGGTNNWSSRNDNLFISSKAGTGNSPNTDSSWTIFVQGAASRVQDPAGPANRWLYYDGSVLNTGTGSGTYVDSGMNFYFGVAYHFEVITDPRDKSYYVTVSDNTGTNATLTSPILRWRAYPDPTRVAVLSSLHFGGGANDVNSTLNFSVDNIAISHLAPSNFPPRITLLSPGVRPPPLTNLASLLSFTPTLDSPQFYPAGKGITFVASTGGGGSNDLTSTNYFMSSAGTTIPANGIGLVLNGADVSGSLAVSGAPDFRKVAYHGLTPNTVYSGLITVTNSAGARKTQRLNFDTFDENFVRYLEAEDYNYSNGSFERDGSGSAPTAGGLFLEEPLPSDYTNGVYLNRSNGYVDRMGMTTNGPSVDYFDTTLTNFNTANNVYRIADAVGTTPVSDFRRFKHTISGARDFQVSLMQPNEWLNYTRTFAPGVYNLYLRASSTGTSSPNNQYVNLDLLTSDPTQPGQTTTNLGTFLVPYTGNAGVFTNVPLIETNGNTIIPLTLGGQQTLRLTALNANNNLQLNYLLLVPAVSNAPSVTITNPADGSSFSSGATVTLNASATPGAAIAKVEYFNGAQSLGSSTTSPYTVNWAGVPTGRYSITAKATTTGGFSASSPAIQITAGSPAKKVLFVIGNPPSGGNIGDQFVQDMMVAKGWEVKQLGEANVNQLGPSVANGFDLVVVSGTIGSGNINVNYRDIAAPVFNWENSIQQHMSMNKEIVGIDYGPSGSRQAMEIPPESVGDPAAAGYSGTNNISIALNSSAYAVPNQNAIRVTRFPEPPKILTSIFYYKAGAEMFNGVIAPAVRYQWFQLMDYANATNLTAFGSNLLSAGLDVAMANPAFAGAATFALGQPVLAGGNVTIPFTAGTADQASAFSLWTSETLSGPYTKDNTAIITQVGPGRFQASTAINAVIRFYRVQKE